MAITAPLLDLQTLIERPIIKVDGNAYELYSPDELTIIQSQWFTRAGQQIEALGKGDDEQALLDKLTEVARRALVAMPEEVFAKLTDRHKTAIVQVFTSLLLGDRAKAAGAVMDQIVKAFPLTGDKSSRGSAASTAARRATGSGKRKGRS
ncbi:hypothetical protein [Pelagibacterium halotolerans]|uniref:Uncharacterized protein n=1 Tax=Pelagibacterium halotolerans (strain DSM 22347 / JCM 15775 / CGMCC 1.7692 / B2) TaxID=1082931 RepID=G4RDC2_PELHB|nr:hypothetical protein [Pelagibacterium halotolerans]AEQ50748.1 hypothetical protein KKY_709 [Pelagibacterium halotolerans B2]QJR19332.1 hypothetical protein HKM20_13315 [Pelagibacterium halotolerans]SDZ94767.1 hypothetical protein SAMN05428936_101635 [Pelagibacterium halotolerans]